MRPEYEVIPNLYSQIAISYTKMSNNNPRIILHVDMDYFFAQYEERERPKIKGKPVVVCVYSGRTEESGAVSTSNYEARRLGVKAGIPISRAKKLAPRGGIPAGAYGALPQHLGRGDGNTARLLRCAGKRKR